MYLDKEIFDSYKRWRLNSTQYLTKWTEYEVLESLQNLYDYKVIYTNVFK